MKSSQTRLNSIDALRGLAALTIVFYHARSMLWIGLDQTWKRYGLSADINAWLGYATAPLYFGGLAVELFFVLSGYCIHRRGAQNLATNPNAQLNLKQFAFRRLWRLYPTYFVALCITALVDTYVRAYHPMQVRLGQDNSFFAFCMSLLSLQGLAAPTFGSNTVFWTLALELHLYAVYPLLYYISRKHGPIKALGVTWVASLIYVLVDMLLDMSNMFPYGGSGGPIFLPYWFTWAFGFYIAEVEAGRASLPKKFWLIAVIGAILAVPISMLRLWDLARFSSTLAFGGLVYWSITPKGNYFWSFSLGRFLAGIGLFSYSLYAVHRPCLLMFKVTVAPTEQQFINLIPTLIGAMIAMIAAWFLFILVEQWTLKPLSWKGKS